VLSDKNLIVFIGIGFIVTVLIWGFVGGCGTTSIHYKAVKSSSETGSITREDAKPASGKESSDISDGKIIYIVKPGDTLWEISRNFKISLSSIKKMNKLDKDTIAIGQKLILPYKGKTLSAVKHDSVEEVKDKTGLIVYKVRKRDSLWRIAQIYGTTVDRIAGLNGIPKNARLKQGQEILVPGNK